MNSENRVRKKYRHLFQTITLIYVISLISCNKNREKRPMTLSEQINTRDSIAADRLSQIGHDEHIKDTITGTWKYYGNKDSHVLEMFHLILKKNAHNDSITGSYELMKLGKPERGIIIGYITGKKAIAEFYAQPGSSKDKGKIELLGWSNKKYDSMKVNLIEAPVKPSFFPQTFILDRKKEMTRRGCQFLGRKKSSTK
ncbi:hypothetical protein [Chryseobacterium timonianum]|uniref:hypothetical protein n=1 Tax=Chryseobacterium timonianum TaxID=1805473 RepID=UPI00083A2514|nr:hypothetical protein [Chryseobacterium timonianum]